MNTKKLLLTAGLLLSTAAHADNWADAFAAFGGVNNVLPRKAEFTVRNAGETARKAGGTPEMYAIARWMSPDNRESKIFDNKTTFDNDDVLAVGQALAQPRFVQQTAPAAQQPAQSTWQWLTGGKPAAPAAPSAADQAKVDAAIAAANHKALNDIVNSGASGFNLYKQYVDQIIKLLQNAVGSIDDDQVQSDVKNYIKQQVAQLQATKPANSYNSRVMGKFDSKNKKKKYHPKKKKKYDH